MPMTYLRKTATYTVVAPDGERLLVDEFESATCSGSQRTMPQFGEARLLLRSGEPVTFIDDRTFLRVKNGEHLSVVHKE